MRTERGLGRLVGFSDGVVAIAITLLVLPLVTAATEVTTDAWTFLVANAYQLFVFVLSFAVIGRFWIVHHQTYENVIGYRPAMLWATLFWLLTIVLLPFPTQLLASSDHQSPLVYCLYIGTMLATALASLLQQSIIVRHPEVQNPEVQTPYVSIVIVIRRPDRSSPALWVSAVLSPWRVPPRTSSTGTEAHDQVRTVHRPGTTSTQRSSSITSPSSGPVSSSTSNFRAPGFNTTRWIRTNTRRSSGKSVEAERHLLA